MSKSIHSTRNSFLFTVLEQICFLDVSYNLQLNDFLKDDLTFKVQYSSFSSAILFLMVSKHIIVQLYTVALLYLKEYYFSGVTS